MPTSRIDKELEKMIDEAIDTLVRQGKVVRETRNGEPGVRLIKPKPGSGFKGWRNSPAGVAKDRRPLVNRPKVTLPKFNLP